MRVEALLVYGTLLAILLIPMLTRWRYDLVAVLGLLLLTVLGIATSALAFSGFGHPAVIAVVAVLVLSRGLQNAGVVDLLTRWMGHVGPRYHLQLAALCAITAIVSAFMNYVGALARCIRLALRLARSILWSTGQRDGRWLTLCTGKAPARRKRSELRFTSARVW
ncbi:MAG: SLC13 family permease [Anaerolineae bacterium]